MSEKLLKHVPLLRNKKILVIGDVMLDEHIWSKVNRISPEAPVPVAEVTNITHVPGGAANVALNIKTLGGLPTLVGIIGNDSSGDKLIKVLKKDHINTAHVIRNSERPTILKSRIIAVSQQVVRVDREEKDHISSKIQKRIITKVKTLIRASDAVIISDYGKGLLSNDVIKTIISSAKKRKIPVSVDPKGTDYIKYKGATVITPNKKEAVAASKIDIIDQKSLLKAGKELLNITKGKYILITRGADGMSLFSRDTAKAITIPAVPREVFDITGAGDTVISALTLALSAKIPINDVIILANFAASIAVSKIGTAPVYLDELSKCLAENIVSDKKVKTRIELKEILKTKKEEGNTIVFTNGCFDILHAGHIRYLEEAKKYGDILVVGLNSDSSVRKIKDRTRPYNPQNERAEILAALGAVDYVTIFSEDTPSSLLSELRPDMHIKGGDYKKITSLPEAKVVKAYGGKVIIVPETKGKSTTNLIAKIRRGE